jgi:hypothetical protein
MAFIVLCYVHAFTFHERMLGFHIEPTLYSNHYVNEEPYTLFATIENYYDQKLFVGSTKRKTKHKSKRENLAS